MVSTFITSCETLWWKAQEQEEATRTTQNKNKTKKIEKEDFRKIFDEQDGKINRASQASSQTHAAPSSNPPPPSKAPSMTRQEFSDELQRLSPMIYTPVVINKLIPPSHKTNPFLTKESFVTNWYLLGPFSFTSKQSNPANSEAINHVFFPNENSLNITLPAPNGSKWFPVEYADIKSTKAGWIDIGRLIGRRQNTVAYAIATLYCPKKMSKLNLCVGGSDYLKIWINRNLVYTYNSSPRQADWDQAVVENINLAKGMNSVVVKCANIHGEWGFFFRLTNKDGMPICAEHESNIR